MNDDYPSHGSEAVGLAVSAWLSDNSSTEGAARIMALAPAYRLEALVKLGYDSPTHLSWFGLHL